MVAPKFANRDVSRLRAHEVWLRGQHVTLRPMTEDDWGVLLPWNNDPEVMHFADARPFEESTLEDVQSIYRWTSTHAFRFIVEVGAVPIGECWLQEMNLQRILDQFPGKDLRRIDIMIGEKEMWGRGHGTEAIGLLVDFGFQSELADAILAPGLTTDNPRSRRAFEKNGFEVYAAVSETEDVPSGFAHDLVLSRDEYVR